MTPAQFAYDELKDYTVYSAILKTETNPDFRRILTKLTEHERQHYQFWLTVSQQKELRIHPLIVLYYTFIRRVLGLTFMAKFMEHHERNAIKHYSDILERIDDNLKGRVREIIEHEQNHEWELINQINEEKVKFTGSIILGLNDGLIELTGALVGFSFAFASAPLVALTGFITGIAASMSMASSAYLQARHEKGKNPKKAAAYTGVSYLVIVLLLIAPFLFASDLILSLALLAVIVLAIIAALSFYTSILFDRKFKNQFGEIFTFSIGVAFVSFLIGSAFRYFSGIAI